MESDKEKESRETNKQALNVEDLSVEDSQQDDVKGGGWYLRNQSSSGSS